MKLGFIYAGQGTQYVGMGQSFYENDEDCKNLLDNVKLDFDLKDKDIVFGKRILLIDDVKTTGSTLNECAKMLNIYGAESVWAATLAVAVPKEKGDRK